MSSLALLGGAPLRTRPFTVEPMLDHEEEEMVVAAVRQKNFSRYIGISVPESVLRLTSAEAVASDDYWHYLGGPNVRAFAAEWAAVYEVPYVIPTTSATIGLGLALAAAGVGPGDEVIVPAISFSATGNAVLLHNSIPVFVDVDPLTFCIDPDAIERAITPSTKAILPVHLTGNLADMDRILEIARRHKLTVIEDACQALGARWRGQLAGTLGDAGVFSLQQSKNIMSGEGGIIVTRDAEIAKRCRLMVNHGEVVFDDSHSIDDLANVVGQNYRMPELCAAVGRAQLKKLPRVNAWRIENARLLRELLAPLPGIELPPSQRGGNGPAEDVPHMFVALFNAARAGLSRDLFVAALRAEGVPVGTGYVRTLYENPTFLKKTAYGDKGCPWTCGHYKGSVEYRRGQCPVAESLLAERFLWFYHIAYSSTADDMREIATACAKVLAQADALRAAEPTLLDKLNVRGAGRIGVAPSQLKHG